MQATITFDVEVERVPETMRCLVLEEAHMVNAAIEKLEGVTCETLSRDIDEVLERLRKTTLQLEQYQSMMIHFEKARFETLLPQQAPPLLPNFVPPANVVNSPADLISKLDTLSRFDEFVGSMNEDERSGEDDSEEG